MGGQTGYGKCITHPQSLIYFSKPTLLYHIIPYTINVNTRPIIVQTAQTAVKSNMVLPQITSMILHITQGH